MSTLNHATPILSGVFSDENAKALINALSSLTKVGIERLCLEFKTGETKSLYVNALNSIGTVSTRLTFDPSILDGFTIQNDFKYGINNLPDFIGLIDIFKNGFELKMAPEIASISSNENYLDYYGAEPTKIKRGEDGDIDSPILSTLTCDASFKEFLGAAGKMDHKHIIFKSNITENYISLSVADKDIRGNSFTKKIQTLVNSDFKVAINKEHFGNVLNIGTVFNIYREVIQLKKIEKLYSIEYFILTLI